VRKYKIEEWENMIVTKSTLLGNSKFNGNQSVNYNRLKHMHLISPFAKENDGVSNIVTSIMMLGIFLTILAMIFTLYIPLWAKTGESNHMENVESSFLELKSTIDKQLTDDEGIGSTYSTSIKLGAEGGVILGIGRTTGNLDFEPGDFLFTVINSDDPLNIYGNSYGNIKFVSENLYYTDQYFTYENGGVIVEQDGKAAIRAEPHFNIDYDQNSNKTTIDTSLIMLNGNPDGLSGTGHHTISTKLVQSVGKSNIFTWTEDNGFPYGQNITFNMTTQYGQLWYDFFESRLDDLPNIIRNTTTSLSITSVTDPVTEEKTYNIILKINEINVLNLKKGIVEIKVN
jgi:hypothetical protein